MTLALSRTSATSSALALARHHEALHGELASKLRAHIAVEEQVLHPVATPIGDYLKLQNCPRAH